MKALMKTTKSVKPAEVEKKWHDAVVGRNGTTLNAIIGEDKTLSIKLGADAGQASEDYILVRGISGDVDRAVADAADEFLVAHALGLRPGLRAGRPGRQGQRRRRRRGEEGPLPHVSVLLRLAASGGRSTRGHLGR